MWTTPLDPSLRSHAMYERNEWVICSVLHESKRQGRNPCGNMLVEAVNTNTRMIASLSADLVTQD